MGIGLVVEVLTHAPAALGPSERMVLIAIAEDARDATRESWTLTRAELCRRAGMRPEALKKALQRLAQAGLEVRVPLKFSESGQPVYAYEGKQSTYRLPQLQRGEQLPPSEPGADPSESAEEAVSDSPLSPQEPGTDYRHSTPEGGTQSPLFAAEGGTDSPEGGTASPPTPHYPSSTSPSEKYKGGAGANARPRAQSKATEEHPAFAEWYTAYPLRKARGAAVKAYAKALHKTDPETLLAAAKRYCDDPQVLRGYAKHPATWLNQECWLDEQAAPLAETGTEGRGGPRANVNQRDWSNGFNGFGQKRNRR